MDSCAQINPTNTESTIQEDKESSPHPSCLDPTLPAFVADTPSSIPTNQQNIAISSMENNEINPAPNNSNIVQAQLNAISRLLEVQNQNRLPLPQPGMFSGDPLQFPIWLKAFETLIESRALNPAERLHFLGNYVTGEAKELIKGFMLLDGEDSYQKAKKMLNKRFGDSFAVASAFRKRLEAWPQISPNDA